jgi:hypothetical protein
MASVERPLEVIWRGDMQRNPGYGPALLEVQLVPATPMRLEARTLTALPEQLISWAVRGGYFEWMSR